MRRLAGRRGRRGLLFAGIAIVALALAGAAFAFWMSTDSSNPAAAVADSIQAGNTPTLGGINGQDVTINWTATTTVSGASVTGYTINRYSVASGGTPTAATGGCSGTLSALTCTEQSVPAGTWYYAVTPKISLWSGTESARLSTSVVAASFSVTSNQFVRATANVAGGSIAHFKNNETVVFHLDNSSGATMTGSVSAVNGSGSAGGFTVTVPAGTAQGSHTIVAVGGSGSQATSNSFTVDNTAPTTTDNTASIGSGWFNTTKTVTLTPTDSGGAGIAATYYTTDGTTPTTGSSQGTSIALATDGVYTIKYFSVDNAGNTEAVKTAGTQIHIDKTNPTPATLSLPANIKNGQVLTNAATDPTVNGASSGVASVAYYYCLGTSCTPNTLIGSSSTGPSYSVTWVSQPADGTYLVQAVATDNAGNTGSSATAQTKVDNTGPSGGSVTYTNGYVTTASVSVTLSNGTDGGSGINTATTQLQRASTSLGNGTCGGTYSSFATIATGPASPYADTSVAGGNCYKYQYVVTDNAGNSTTYTSASVAQVDTTAPVFTITSTGTNVFWSGSTVYFKNGGSGSFTVTVSDPESGISSATLPTTFNGWTVSPTTAGATSRTYTLGSANSNSSITVSASNNAGLANNNVSISTTLDNTAPTYTNSQLTIAPVGNSTTVGFVAQGAQYYVYSTSPTDAGSGIGTVTANVTTVTTGQAAVPLVAGSYTVGSTTYTYRSAALTATNPLTAGNKNITGTATDNAGNSTTTANKTVVVDNTAPTGSITAPSNGFAGASTTVTANSADATAGVYSAQFQYSPSGAGTWNTIGTAINPGPYSVTWDTTALTNGGSYDLRVITTDNASNTFTSPTVTVTVDKVAPAAPSTPVLATDTGVAGDNITNSTTPTFTGTAEAGSTVTIYDGGTAVGSGTATGGNYSVTTSTLTQGAHTITATATDAAGNVSPSSGSVTITVDSTAPTITSVKLANGTGTAGKADQGDTATFIFSKQLNATTLCSTWTNSGVQTLSNVTATITNNAGNDPLTVSSPTCTLNFGSDVLGDYTSATSTFLNSTITWNPSTNTLTITLGTFNTGNLKTGVATKQQVYTASAAITDIAGNTISNSPFTDTNKTQF